MRIDHSIKIDPLPGTPTREEINLRRLDMYITGVKADQKKDLGLLVAGIAAFMGAFIWLLVTYLSNTIAIYMALPIGLMTGYAVRYFGRGMESKFGWYAASFTLFGTLFGNYMAIIMLTARHYKFTFIEIFGQLSLDEIPDYILDEIGILQIVFHLVTIVIAFFLGFQKLSQKEIDRIMN